MKARCYWEHSWGTRWEPVGNKGKLKKIRLSPAPKLKRDKQGTLSACWGFPLGAWKFCSRNCLSPFLTFINTPIVNWEYLWFIQLRGCTQHQICKSLLYFFFPFHFCFYSSRYSNSYCKTHIKYLLSSFFNWYQCYLWLCFFLSLSQFVELSWQGWADRGGDGGGGSKRRSRTVCAWCAAPE
jgi:hypothetical protein